MEATRDAGRNGSMFTRKKGRCFVLMTALQVGESVRDAGAFRKRHWMLPCLLASALMAGTLAAQAAGDMAEAYANIEKSFTAGQWKPARGALMTLIAEHENDEFLRAHSAAIVEMRSECDFRMKHKEPKIEEFLEGKATYNKNSGDLEVKYTNDKKGHASAASVLGSRDWETRGEQSTFRIPFVGPHQVSVEGVMPASQSMGRQPQIEVCQGDESELRFLFTWPTTRGPGRVFEDWSLGELYITDKGVERRLLEDNRLGVKYSLMYGERYDVKVSVNKSNAVGHIHEISFLNVDRPAGKYGSVTLGWFPNVEKVVLKGIIDKGWMDSRLAAYAAEARSEFMENYDARAGLPAWLFAAAEAAPSSEVEADTSASASRSLEWAEVLEAEPDPKIVTDEALALRLRETGLPWRVRDRASGIEMLCVPHGRFRMGATADDDQAQEAERPDHDVTITSDFYIGRCETRVSEWEHVISGRPLTKGDGPPMTGVSYDGLQEFLVGSGGLELPTEAQWEYAARAGDEGASPDDVQAVTWNVSNAEGRVQEAGSREPNGLGLHDMLGNAWEWCADWHDDQAYQNCADGCSDPVGPDNSSGQYKGRVLRGGGFMNEPTALRFAWRIWRVPGFSEVDCGFRVARRP
jgi:formylglycine-generating enzyme required for sulfatase activity